jgi:hypothetical protein
MVSPLNCTLPQGIGIYTLRCSIWDIERQDRFGDVFQRKSESVLSLNSEVVSGQVLE